MTKEYIEYINSQKWKKFRKQIICERGHKCEKCGDTGNLHLHHHHYNNLFNESGEDVILVCIPCHEKIHEKRFNRRARKKMKAKGKIRVKAKRKDNVLSKYKTFLKKFK